MLRVARWHGALAAALFASSLGLFSGNHVFFLVATVPLGYVIYGLLTGLGPPSLTVSRSIAPEQANPDEPVTITLTVENTGDRPIPDLRIIDTLPDDVTVTGGSHRACVALRPGEEVTVEYDAVAARGTHDFGNVVVRGRSLAGTVVGTTELEPSGTDRVVCDTLLQKFPLQDQTTLYAGKHPTDDGGRGVEFHAIRQYQRGDPMNRIHWPRLARTGELATIDYREERAASIVFVIDERESVALRSPQGGPPATDLSVYAAAQGFVTLTGLGHEVGVTTLSPAETRDWVSPGRGEATETAATRLFRRLQSEDGDERIPGAPPSPDEGGDQSTPDSEGGEQAVAADGAGDAVDGQSMALRLAERLPAAAQVVLCTPLADDAPIEVSETLLANGHAVTVLSPDVARPTAGQNPTPGQAVADIGRRARFNELTALGIPTTDWRTDQALQVALTSMLAGHGGRWQ